MEVFLSQFFPNLNLKKITNKKSRSTVIAQLNSDHEKALLGLDSIKKQIDDHFKIELKSLSKTFS